MTSSLLLEDVIVDPSNILPPAYILLVSGVYVLFGPETTFATVTLQVINALATSVAVVLVFGIARRLHNSKTGWLAALLIAVNPTIFGYTNLIWDTSLFILAVCFVVWILLRFSDRPECWKRQVGFGLLLGAVAYLNPAFTAAYPFLVLWMLTRRGNRSKRAVARGVVLVTIGWLTAVTPWTMRNYHHFGKLSYIRGSLDIQLWLGACPEAFTNPSEVYATWYPMNNADEQRKLIEKGEQAYFQEWGEMARKAIRADFPAWTKLCFWRAVDYWTGTVFSHADPKDGGWPTNPPRAAVAILMLLETFLLAMGLILVRRIGADVWWLVGIVGIFSIVYVLTHVQVRYRAPMEPIIAVLLAILATRISDHRLKRETPPGQVPHAVPDQTTNG